MLIFTTWSENLVEDIDLVRLRGLVGLTRELVDDRMMVGGLLAPQLSDRVKNSCVRQ